MTELRVKRIYDDPDADDGRRVLVDRLWPRGVSKEDAALDEWAKDLAPSDDLREWFDHDPERWDEFRARYGDELDEKRARVREALLGHEGPVTLLYATTDTEHNNAIALRDYALRLANDD